MGLRAAALRVASTGPANAAVAVADRLPGPARRTIAVLTYHRVVPEDEAPAVAPGSLSATVDAFDAQVGYLAARRSVLTGEHLVAIAAGEAAVPANAVVVTFDDAYRDVADHAWPVLRRHGVPAVLFVPTGFPDRPERAFWWDRLHGAVERAAAAGTDLATPVGVIGGVDPFVRAAGHRRLRRWLGTRPPEEVEAVVDELEGSIGGSGPHPGVLGWDELQRLAAEGLTLAPHSVLHPNLTRCDDARLVDEIAGSASALTREVGTALPLFAYPGGHHDDRVVAATARAGFVVALTTVRGVNEVAPPGDDRWLRLRRINVGGTTPLAALRAQLLPVAAHSRRWRGASRDAPRTRSSGRR